MDTGQQTRLDGALSDRARIVLWFIGYGCFMAIYHNGLSVPFSSSLADITWSNSLIIQAIYLLSTGIGILLLRLLLRPNHRHNQTSAGIILIIASIMLCFIAQYLVIVFNPSFLSVLLGLFACISGFLSAYPLLFWFTQLCDIYKTVGQSRCVAALAFGQLFIIITLIISGTNPIVMLIGNLCLLFGTSICIIRLRRVQKNSDAVAAYTKPNRRFQLNMHSAILLITFGITWGLANGIIIFGSFTLNASNSLWWVLLLVQILVSSGLLIYFMNRHSSETTKYGFFIRISISLMGLVLMLIPLFSELFPNALYPCCLAVNIFQCIVMWLFVIEVSIEEDLDSVNVFSTVYFLIVIVECLVAGFCLICLDVIGGSLGWNLLSALAAIATVILIPLLPSSSSNAVVFTFKELPENETYETRLERTYETMIKEYGFTQREGEVFRLLAMGLTRQEIAHELSLSGWTVKDYISSIYTKTQTHSYKELMHLVTDESRL